MPVVKCAICGKELKLSRTQFRLMHGTIMTCSNDCAVKAIEKPEE